MRLKLVRLVPPILIALAPLFAFWRLVFAGQVLYWGLPLYQFYPWRMLTVEAIRSGHLPLWSDLLGNGTPLLANHQSAAFYPLNLIYLLFPIEHAMGYSVVLHLIMAGLFAYAWARTIELSRFGALVCGLCFMLSGFFVSRTQFITIVNGAAWLPLLFLLAERLIKHRSFLDTIWLGVGLALQFLAGHAQLWFYSLWVLAAYGTARTWNIRRNPVDRDLPESSASVLFKPLALLMGAFVFGSALSAIQVLPTAELSLHSQRADGLDPTEAMTYSFWPWRMLTLAVPNLFGSPASGDYWGYATYWEDAAYIGVLPLLLAFGFVMSVPGGAALKGGQRRLASQFRGSWSGGEKGSEFTTGKGYSENSRFIIAFLLVLTCGSLVLAMGSNTPVYPFVFKYIPGFGAFRAPARFLLFYVFGVSTLAGVGADRFRLTYRSQYAARLTIAGAGAMLVVSLAMGQSGLPIRPTFAPALARFALWLGLSAIALLLGPAQAGLGSAQAGLSGQETGEVDSRGTRSALSPGVWRGLIVCLITVDLLLFAMPLTPSIDPSLYRSVTDMDRFLLARGDDDRLFATYLYDYDTKFNGYFDLSDWGPSELAYWLSFREALVPNLNVLSGTASANNDDPLVVGRWRRLMDVLRKVEWPERLRLLRIMNVGYVLEKAPPPGLSSVESVPNLYRLSKTLPRAWVVSRARVIASSEDLPQELSAPAFDPASEVLLESAPNSPGKPGILASRGFAFAPRADRCEGAEPEDHFLYQSRATSVIDPQLSLDSISLREGGNGRTIDLVMSQPGYLVLAYTAYPGWRATVDGRPAEILRANYAFMAVALEPGEHRVTLCYQPISVRLGALISAFSLLGAIVIVALRIISGSIYRGK